MKTKTIKTVDDYLNEVDYSELKETYKPSPFAMAYMNFVKTVNKDNDDIQTSPLLHYKMVEGLACMKTHIANLCSRGLAKTTIYGEMLVLYLAVFKKIPNFGKVDVIIYVGDTMENGAKSFRNNVESRYNNSDLLKQMLPEVNFTDNKINFTNAEGEKTAVRMFGAKTGVRGFKEFGKRPTLAILDDIINDEAANSAVQLDKIKHVIYNEVSHALNPLKKKIVFNGTPFNKNDPLYEAIESGAWHVNVFPVCNEFPCSRKQFVGAWEERFTYDFLKAEWDLAVATGKTAAFQQELMLRITSQEDRVILDSDIRWFKAHELLEKKHLYNFVITTDFATSNKHKSDFTVIGVWALGPNNNRFLVDGIIGRQLMNQTFNDLFKLVKKYAPISVGIETAGQQGAFISLIKDEMHRRDTYFNLARGKDGNREGIPSRNNKMDRLRLSVPFWKNGHMHLPEDLKHTALVQELLQELSSVTLNSIKSKHDDCLDMVSQLEQMRLLHPDPEENRKIENQELISKDDVFGRTRFYKQDNISIRLKGYL